MIAYYFFQKNWISAHKRINKQAEKMCLLVYECESRYHEIKSSGEQQFSQDYRWLITWKLDVGSPVDFLQLSSYFSLLSNVNRSLTVTRFKRESEILTKHWKNRKSKTENFASYFIDLYDRCSW